jgi:hypothetical protein
VLQQQGSPPARDDSRSEADEPEESHLQHTSESLADDSEAVKGVVSVCLALSNVCAGGLVHAVVSAGGMGVFARAVERLALAGRAALCDIIAAVRAAEALAAAGEARRGVVGRIIAAAIRARVDAQWCLSRLKREYTRLVWGPPTVSAAVQHDAFHVMDAIVDALPRLRGPLVRKAVKVVFRCLVSALGTRGRAGLFAPTHVPERVIAALAGTMGQHSGEAATQIACMQALRVLCSDVNLGFTHAAVRAGVVEHVLASLLAHDDVETLVHAALALLQQMVLCRNRSYDDIRSAVHAAHGVPIVIAAIRRWSGAVEASESDMASSILTEAFSALW